MICKGKQNSESIVDIKIYNSIKKELMKLGIKDETYIKRLVEEMNDLSKLIINLYLLTKKEVRTNNK